MPTEISAPRRSSPPTWGDVPRLAWEGIRLWLGRKLIRLAESALAGVSPDLGRPAS